MTIKTPPLTDALREAAKRQPGTWLYVLDPVFDPNGEVPPTGIVGAWQVDDRGELTGDFTPNPSYVPSPVARGWRTPESRLEFALQAAGAGLGSTDDLRTTFVESTVWIYSGGSAADFFLADLGGGSRGVFAYSDRELASASGTNDVRNVSGGELLARIPDGALVVLNSGSPVFANLNRDRCFVATTDE